MLVTSGGFGTCRSSLYRNEMINSKELERVQDLVGAALLKSYVYSKVQ